MYWWGNGELSRSPQTLSLSITSRKQSVYLSPHLMKTPESKPVLQQPKTPREKAEEIEVIARASIAPEDVVVIRTTNPIVFLQEQGYFGASRELLMR